MEDIFEYVKSILQIFLTTILYYGFLKLIQVEPSSLRGGLFMAFVFWGSVFVFAGKHLTGSGFWAGSGGSIRYVDKSTPEIVWRFAGFSMWFISALILIFID